MANKSVKRLGRELEKIGSDGTNGTHEVIVRADAENIHRWYFVLRNLEGVYEGGVYLGEINFPDNYPFKAPTIKMITPNGRFEVGKTICTTFSHYHPEEWSPKWSGFGMVYGLLSFLYEEDEEGVAGIKLSDNERKRLAVKSKLFNAENGVFVEYFSELLEK